MANHLAIVVYRALVGGQRSDTLDVQVRWFADGDPDSIRRRIKSEPESTYLNPDGKVVVWELSGLIAIEPFEPRESGEEIVGFIASSEELFEID